MESNNTIHHTRPDSGAGRRWDIWSVRATPNYTSPMCISREENNFIPQEIIHYPQKPNQYCRRTFNEVPFELKNVVTWTVMIDGYARKGEMEGARLLFEDMPQRNFFVWSSMISGYCKIGNVKEARAIFDRVPVRNLVIKDVCTSCSSVDSGNDPHHALLLNIYAASGSWEKAGRVSMVVADRGLQKTSGRSSLMLENTEQFHI
ncbi:hypothetical protein OIU79_015362 [Salix purpurea]|uniref:Pentatricopeptide repeat-containing protein n=1 Tax=Salix purpurea TaxID=77065 RepID=A0A9Q0PBK0_SALPP|nr:hypothetical protein OIU79_015362 [Salix purpurea]